MRAVKQAQHHALFTHSRNSKVLSGGYPYAGLQTCSCHLKRCVW